MIKLFQQSTLLQGKWPFCSQLTTLYNATQQKINLNFILFFSVITPHSYLTLAISVNALSSMLLCNYYLHNTMVYALHYLYYKMILYLKR